MNGEPTAGLRQTDVVERLKKIGVGDSVKMLISRIEKENDGAVEGANVSSSLDAKDTTEKRSSEDEKIVENQVKAAEKT